MKIVTYKIQFYFDDGWIFAKDGDHDIEIPLNMADDQLYKVAINTGCPVRLVKIETKTTIIKNYVYN